jgi:4-diphosphocytidyl-2-C-methyl-D-erythritol kinase
MPAEVRVWAHAKINLDLRVNGVRADGFHELRTVFQSLALHDTLWLSSRPGPFRITCAAPGVPVDSSNLVWQAAEALWRALGKGGRLRDVAVRLDKRVPAEAGLGGGSADAAATLKGLARLWAVRMSTVQLANIAAGLGSDVPFFLTGGAALGVGRGDEITPLPDRARESAVLVIPAFGVSSLDAYAWYDAAPPPASSRGNNDLEPVVTARHPEIGLIRRALEDAGARSAAMTGSGSTVYGLFEAHEEAARAATLLESRRWRVVLTETLDRPIYARRARPVLVRT